MSSQNILLFGDQAVEKLQAVQKLVRFSKTCQPLARFLREATDVIQTEAAKATPAERECYGSFNTFLELAEHHQLREEPEDFVGAVIICVARIGELIYLSEHDPSLLATPKSQLHVLGFCSGLLPGSVAAMARSTSELHAFGLTVVPVALRLALELTRRSRRIEDSSRSWGCALVGIASEKLNVLLKEFNEKENLPIARQAFIGITSKAWTTVFGPPSVLDKLWTCHSDLTKVPKVKLIGAAAVHAPHLPPIDFERIVGNAPRLQTPIPAGGSFVSSTTCQNFNAFTYGELLHLIVKGISQELLPMEGTVAGLISNIKKHPQVDNIKITMLGPTPHVTLVERMLQKFSYKVNVTVTPQPSSVPESVREGSNLIAIVGMAARVPGAGDLPAFWDMLESGNDAHGPIPEGRFDTETIKNVPGADPSKGPYYGCFLDAPGAFDTRLFNISPREAAQMDPSQRLLLMTGFEALETAGYTKNGSTATHGSRISTYFGQCTDDWRTMNDSQDVDVYYVPGTMRAFAPGRLHYHFKWAGSYFSVDAACATSLTAVSMACNALQSRECDTALAGGANILATAEMFVGLKNGGFLSKTGACKSFREDADGYCRAEAAGVVVLKRLEDAIADKDNIQAVVRGFARNYNAGAASITQPHVESQEALFRQILNQSSLQPNEIDFVEMHGTGTQVGDPIEMKSVTNVFAQGRTKFNPLVVGAVKANVGHSEAAAGITSLIKAVLMLKNDVIPPQPGAPFATNLKYENLGSKNVQIATQAMPFKAAPTSDGKRRIIVNNFDAAGGNTCILIEDSPQIPRPTEVDARPYQIVACSGRTSFSLRENKRRLRDYLCANTSVKLADVAYTTTARRQQEVYRDAYVVQTVEELVQTLSKEVAADNLEATAPGINSGSAVFVFTGQGSQYAGMGKQLFESSPKFRELLVSYQELCTLQGLPSFLSIITSADSITHKSPVEIQLAIAALEIALANLWISWGVEPSLLIGHSLGEYAALCVSGVLSVSDALYLVGRRATLMTERCVEGSHGMLAVASSAQAIPQLLDTKEAQALQIACINAPESTVIGGKLEDIASVQTHLQAKGVKATLLQTPYAFHTAQIEPIMAEYEAVAKGVHFGKPRIPIASTLLGRIVEDGETFNGAYLAKQARNPVNYVGALEAAISAKFVNDKTVFLENGPKPVCSGLIRSTLKLAPSKFFTSLNEGQGEWHTLSRAVAGLYLGRVSFDWSEFHKDFKSALSLLDLPTYAFDLKDYWRTYKKEKFIEAPATPIIQAKPLSTTIQFIEQISRHEGKLSVAFASNISEPSLYNAIKGHMVDGIALCPASVYMDMALAAAKYVYGQAHAGQEVPQMEILNLEICHALVARSADTNQVIKIKATQAHDGDLVEIAFGSWDGVAEQHHGSCRVRYIGSQSDKHEAETIRLLKRRIETLVKSTRTGDAFKLTKPVIYKLFAALVDYGKDYHAIEEAYLENDFSDGVAKMVFKKEDVLGSFTCSPYWSDAIVHLAGFMLNGNFSIPKDIVYIASGLERIHVLKDLVADHEYTCYASNTPAKTAGVVMSNAYLMDGDEIVAIITGIRFQKMTREVFSFITKKAAATTQSKPAKVVSAPASLAPTTMSRSASSTGSTISASSVADDVWSDAGSELSSGTLTPAMSVEEADEICEADQADILLKLVAAETGLTFNEVANASSFADCGVDSMMSVTIITAFKKQTGSELPASFFTKYPTAADVREELGNDDTMAPPPKAPKPATSHTPAYTPARTSAHTPARTATPTRKSKSTKPQAALLVAALNSAAAAAASVAPAAPTTGRVSDTMLAIVARETGVSIKDMNNSMPISDMGVDSIMSVSIVAAFKKETGVELPASFFNNCSTVADIREELDDGAEDVSIQAPVAAPIAAPVATQPVARQTVPPAAPRPATPVAAPAAGKVSNIMLAIVARETGVSTKDMNNSMPISDMGVDSIMSVSIVAAFKKETGVELPASFFNNCSTVADIREELDGVEEVTPAPAIRAVTPAPALVAASRASTPAPVVQPTAASKAVAVMSAQNSQPEPTSRCVLMQGRSKSKDTPLFLITDGSGSVTSYLYVPELPGGRRVYALESPFIEDPEAYTYTVHQMAQCFIEALRKVQPKGPYMIGGWSAGGVYAYETARVLLEQGEQILGLMILDMHMPRPVPVHIDITMDFIESTGLFTGVERATNLLDGISAAQKLHLLMTFRALVRYEGTPMDASKRPDKTFIIWATKGLDETAPKEEVTGETSLMIDDDGDDSEEKGLKSWFFAPRTSFTPNGWEKLVGDNIECSTIEADHFSMVTAPQVTHLGKFLAESVAKATAPPVHTSKEWACGI